MIDLKQVIEKFDIYERSLKKMNHVLNINKNSDWNAVMEAFFEINEQPDTYMRITEDGTRITVGGGYSPSSASFVNCDVDIYEKPSDHDEEQLTAAIEAIMKYRKEVLGVEPPIDWMLEIDYLINSGFNPAEHRNPKQLYNRHIVGMPSKPCIIAFVVSDEAMPVVGLWIPSDDTSNGCLGTARRIEAQDTKRIGYNVWEQNNSEFYLYTIVAHI